MKVLPFWIKIVTVTLLTGCVLKGDGKDGVDMQAKIHLLAAELQAGTVDEIEIMGVPLDTVTRIPISPDKLERVYTSKLILRGSASVGATRGLASALRDVKVERTAEEYDYRTGVVLYDKAGARVMAIFFDNTGKHASIDGVPVKLDGAIYGWLNSNFLACLR